MLLLLVCLCCSGSQVRVESDDFGRVQRKAFYTNDSLQKEEIILYDGQSKLPSGVLIKKAKHGDPELYREVEFKYRDQLLSSEYFYIYRGGKKTRTGKALYSYNGTDLWKIRYYAISDIEKSRVFLSALDLYSYSGERGLQSRRIIEYEYNYNTKKGMQVSQYVIQYENKKIISMQIWVLDKKSNQIISKTETSRRLISEMVHNIQKSISDRVKGTMFFQDANGDK